MLGEIKASSTVRCPKGKPANRRKAEDLRAACQLQLDIAAFAHAEEDASRHKPLPGHRLLYDEDELAEKKSRCSELAGDNHKALTRAFEKIAARGPWRKVEQAPPPAMLDPLYLDYPNFAPVTKLIQQHLCLNRLSEEKFIALPPILLNGPPGVGKTAYCKRLAALLGLRFETIDLSSATTNFALTGLDAGYNSGNPGRIWESLQHDSLSVLWLFDEVDKIMRDGKDGGSDHLLGLLEPVSSRRFVDGCTLLPIDASWICYIATSNYKERIDAPLLSRFEVFDIEAPDASQLRAIVCSIYRDIRKVEPWGALFTPELDSSVIDALHTHTPREIRRRIYRACANAAEQSRTHLLALDIGAATNSHRTPTRRIGFI